MSGTLAPAITVAQFRALFPEFDDSSVYIDEVIYPWLTVATQQLNPARWGAMYDLGIALFTAHQIALGQQATLVASRGGVPGLGYGIVQSKSINGVSVSYNTNMMVKDAGDWNLTLYGIRFISWARMFGSGGQQIVGYDAELINEAQLVAGTAFFQGEE